MQSHNTPPCPHHPLPPFLAELRYRLHPETPRTRHQQSFAPRHPTAEILARQCLLVRPCPAGVTVVRLQDVTLHITNVLVAVIRQMRWLAGDHMISPVHGCLPAFALVIAWGMLQIPNDCLCSPWQSTRRQRLTRPRYIPVTLGVSSTAFTGVEESLVYLDWC